MRYVCRKYHSYSVYLCAQIGSTKSSSCDHTTSENVLSVRIAWIWRRAIHDTTRLPWIGHRKPPATYAIHYNLLVSSKLHFTTKNNEPIQLVLDARFWAKTNTSVSLRTRLAYATPLISCFATSRTMDLLVMPNIYSFFAFLQVN